MHVALGGIGQTPERINNMLKPTANELIEKMLNQKQMDELETVTLSQHQAQSMTKALIVSHIACTLRSSTNEEVLDSLEELTIEYARNVFAYLGMKKIDSAFLLELAKPTLQKYNAEVDVLCMFIAKEKTKKTDVLQQIFDLIAMEFNDIYGKELLVEEGGE